MSAPRLYAELAKERHGKRLFFGYFISLFGDNCPTVGVFGRSGEPIKVFAHGSAAD